MLSYCLKCRKNTESKNPKVLKMKNGRIMVSSNCAVCSSKKSRFIKKQETSGILGSLTNTLCKIPLVGPILFLEYKMNKIINKFLLAGDKVMPEMHLRQPGFTYSACRPFTKTKERIQKFKETGDSKYIYKKELDKACFEHDMAYEDF